MRYMTPREQDMTGIGATFILVLHAFGAGWGSVITLSSFNKFQTNIMSYSWIISFGQIFIYILFGMVSFMLEHYYQGERSEVLSLFILIYLFINLFIMLLFT